jgi:hypothetical protein
MPTGTTFLRHGTYFGFPNSSTKWGLDCAVTDKNNPALGTRHTSYCLPFLMTLICEHTAAR